MIDFSKYNDKSYNHTLTRKILFNSKQVSYDERLSIANRELLKMIRHLTRIGKTIAFVEYPKFVLKKYGDKDVETICFVGYN